MASYSEFRTNQLIGSLLIDSGWLALFKQSIPLSEFVQGSMETWQHSHQSSNGSATAACSLHLCLLLAGSGQIRCVIISSAADWCSRWNVGQPQIVRMPCAQFSLLADEARYASKSELAIPNEIRYFGISVLSAVLSGTGVPNTISVPISITNVWYRMTFSVSLNFSRRQRIFIKYLPDRADPSPCQQVLPQSVRNCS